MKIIFAGCGSAFTTEEYYQSNAIVQSDSGKRLLIDCGSDIRFSLGKLGLDARNIDAVYVSHLHADHIGGMEYLAFVRYFTKKPSDPRPMLFCVPELMKELWENSLRGGLESLEEKVMNITDYFECHPVPINSSFIWEGVLFTPVQTVHIMSGFKITHSYGLMIQQCKHRDGINVGIIEQSDIAHVADFPISAAYKADCKAFGPRVFFTTDTQFCPNQITKFYQSASTIFHDCETAPYFSKVHAHYNDLKTLPPEIKKKMWLYHYQPNPPQDPKADGFLGFVKRGQEIEFEELT
jgi:ribonuclease BN (tRNA processing enzyme)